VYRTDWSRGKALVLYLVGAWFESRPDLRFLVVSSVTAVSFQILSSSLILPVYICVTESVVK
jgi:hypothetical protein